MLLFWLGEKFTQEDNTVPISPSIYTDVSSFHRCFFLRSHVSWLTSCSHVHERYNHQACPDLNHDNFSCIVHGCVHSLEQSRDIWRHYWVSTLFRCINKHFSCPDRYLLITTLFVGNSQAPYEGPYEQSTPLLEPILALNESTNNSTSVVTTPTLTAIEILGSTGTTTPSDQPSVTLANASSKATIIGTVIAGIALVFTIVAGVYQCRKWMKKRRTKKAIAP